MEENSHKITTKKRIDRILLKMCSAKMHIILKISETSKFGIRGKLHSLDTLKGQQILYVDGVSDKAREKLESVKKLKVEVLGMSSRVFFVCEISRLVAGGIVFHPPKKITSVERRNNMRYQTNQDAMAYINFESMSLQESDLASPHVLDLFQDLRSWCGLADLSIGGTCVQTYYQSVSKWIAMSGDMVNGKLVFPMMDPLDMKFHIRWQKKTTNTFQIDGKDRSAVEYRFGLEFDDPSNEHISKIRQFMRQLSMADAI